MADSLSFFLQNITRQAGADYFDELLDRIRAIRASERRFYLKVTDLYEQCSIKKPRHRRGGPVCASPAG